MVFYSQKLKTVFGKDRLLAPGLTLTFALIAMTPLCGYLFACGCSWPGLGLDSACNIHHSQVLHQCPWCASPIAGWLSLGFATLAGGLASLRPLGSFSRQRPLALIGQIGIGISVFVVVALLAGLISASVQDYPMP